MSGEKEREVLEREMSGAASQQQEEDKKPNQVGLVNLKIQGLDGTVMFFTVERNAQLKNIMKTFCDQHFAETFLVVFLFDGRLILGKQTPDELEMVDGDEIDAMWHQYGGGKSNYYIELV